MSDRHANRRAKLLREIKKQKAGAVLVTGVNNVTWLTGFTGDSTYLYLSPDATVLVSDTRYTIQLGEECPGVETVIRDSKQHMNDQLAKLLGKLKPKKLAFEAHLMSWHEATALQTVVGEKVKTLEWVPTSMIVENLRAIKDKEEIAEIRQAVHYAHRGFDFLKATLRAEMTEREAAHELEHTLRKLGAEGVAFEPIIAVGDRAALPHARPGSRRIGEAPFVLIDWGAMTPAGYRSDLTRVLVTGKISPKLEKIYQVVKAAQQAGIEAIKPGVSCKDVDDAARSVIDKAGFGKHFGHGLGHGIGLDIHEQPRFSAISEDVLKPGMIITVEPGIYLTGYGGVRIEDDVLVTRNGHEVLSSVPKNWEDAFITI